MTKKKQEIKTIPKRNYIIALFLVIGAALVTIYAFNLYNLHEEEKLSKSYLMESKAVQYEIQNLEELDSVLAEAPDDYFIYISYTKDADVYDLEEDLAKLVNDYKLKERFYFLNITSIKDDSDYLDKINEALGLDDVVTTTPTILFFINKELANNGVVVREDKNMIQASDFVKLLDQYEIYRDME